MLAMNPANSLSTSVLAGLLAGALSVLSADHLAAQALRGEVVKPEDSRLDARDFDARRLILKFVEGSRVRLRSGALRAADATSVQRVQRLLVGARVERLFHESEAVLDEQRAQAEKVTPSAWDAPADLNLYYLVQTQSEDAGYALQSRLLADPLVETCFVDHRAGIHADPDDIPPTTPDFTGRQTYFGPAPNGIDIRRSWAIPGARGEGLQILDIETGLILNHEDVPEAIARNVVGNLFRQTDHGVAVASEMVAERNAYGITGGVYNASYKFHSHQAQFWAASVNTAATNSKPGDIIVLEVQLAHPVTRRPVLMEHRQDVFDAVRNATMRGIHVIAAAGNGSQNLDASAYAGIFDRTRRDSGSIVVGATEGVSLQRASFSNYGRIVDANGWGRNVATAGYGNIFYPNRDARQKYSGSFSGTSSATPIVTSAAAALLSGAKFQLGRTLTNAELRGLLQAHGTDVPGGSIGKRPDMIKLLAAIGLPRGLRETSIPKLGGTLDLELSGPSGTLWALWLSPRTASVATPFGRATIDFGVGAPITGGVFAASGTSSFRAAVPNVANLAFQELYWQALRFDVVTRKLDLTSSVASFLEK